MILKVGAWYFIVTGALGILGALGSSFDIWSLLMSGVFVAIGVGLLKKLEWARFVALGICLLGWTLGALMLLVSGIYLMVVGGAAAYVAMMFSGGLFSVLVLIMVLTLAIWVVGIVISYKLFWYLVSEEGCAEFGVPHGSKKTVLISTVGWVVFSMLSMSLSLGMMRQLSTGSMASREDDAAMRALERQREQEARRLERQARADAKERAAEEEEIQAQLEALQSQESGSESNEEPQDVASTPAEDPVLVVEDTPAPEAAPEPAPAPASEADTVQDQPQPSSRKILKCRDASGGITFTQGYCPPGSKQVEM